MKKILLFISILCPLFIFGQELETKNISQNSEMILSFMRLSTQQQIDSANYYFKRNSYDTAFIYYNLLIKTIPQNADIEQQKKVINAYFNLAYIYGNTSNYRNAYDIYIKVLLICEKHNLVSEKAKAYINIGVIYFYLNDYKTAKIYYLKALDLNTDNRHRIKLLSNLGANEILKKNLDSAYNYLNEAIKVSNQYNNYGISGILNNFGSYYQLKKQYDSAFYYFRLALDYSIVNKDIQIENSNLSDIGKLFFELNKTDSALHYIGLSNKIASENQFMDKLAANYLTLSEIEKSKGRYKNALEYYETYITLKDSIFNAGVYGSINLTQQQYEISKKDEQIEELIIDRQIKDNTIHYQKIIQRNTMVALLLLIIVLGIVLLQDNKLRKAYNVLVGKNVEIVELTKSLPFAPSEGDTSPNHCKEASPAPSEGDISSDPSEGGEVETDNYSFEQNSENPMPMPKAETLNVEPETSNLKPETSKINSKVPETQSSKCKEKAKQFKLSEKTQNEILNKVLAIMQNKEIFCKSDFTIFTLAEMIKYNPKYVSDVINKVVNKNFRKFLSSYRIKEAQRIFSSPESKIFTIEHVAKLVGFKSQSSFREAFIENTGVKPNYYLKTLNTPKELLKEVENDKKNQNN